jgi:hypothetical protein
VSPIFAMATAAAEVRGTTSEARSQISPLASRLAMRFLRIPLCRKAVIMLDTASDAVSRPTRSKEVARDTQCMAKLSYASSKTPGALLKILPAGRTELKLVMSGAASPRSIAWHALPKPHNALHAMPSSAWIA